GTPEAYDMIFPGGAFRKALLEAWLTSIWISNSPFRPTEYADDLTWIFDHPVKNDSWNGSSLSMNNRYAYVNVSAIHYGGWYDLFTQATLDGFYGYNYLGGSRAQGKQRLVMGPVGHGEFGRMSRTFNGASTLRFRNANQNPLGEWEYEMRSAAMFNTTINWTTPNVAYYLMGDVADPLVDANKWIYTTGWPVPYNNKSYYLNGNKSLSLAAPGANQTISYLYDPADPVSTKGGNNFCQNATLELDALGTPDPDYLNQRNKYPEGIGPYDQARAQNFSRQDIIVFESPALMTPLTITGRVTANLWVSSNCTDTTFTAMLMDQYENGSCYNIMDGILVMRYRDGIDQVAADLQGVTYYRITIDLWSTAWQFNTGHKIKVAISSSNYPRFERHPNNSNPITNHPSLFNIANNSILCGTGLYNASITLPVVA
nr:CocE/NonD family hydrolase [Candidatus Sigynarchaeota archaeon]